MSDYLTRTNGGTSFAGSDVNIYRATVIASALRLYAKTGLKANRAYTPRAMMTAAAVMTGQTFKARDYVGAADALTALAEAAKAAPRADAVQS
jgi:hypothetical protein